MTARFQLIGVSKSYSQFPALSDVHLKIPDKKITALVGESGCGKSTLARIIMRLDHYDAGEILYKDNKIQLSPIHEFRKRNQIVFQDPPLSVNPCFTIYKILSEPLIIEKKSKKVIKEKIDRMLDLFEISPAYLEKYPSEVSGGELQRIVFARALILEPEFIVLDESFSSLDENLAVRLTRDFKSIVQRLDIGALFISHQLQHVHFLADVIVHMGKGRILL